MYKTVKLDIQEKFGLNKGYYVEIVPIAWLPKSVSQQIASLYDSSGLGERVQNQDTNDPAVVKSAIANLDHDFQFLCKMLAFSVVDWNLEDEEGNKLNTPKNLIATSEASLYTELGKLPMVLTTYIFEAAQSEDYIDIPLVRSTPLARPSIVPMPIVVLEQPELNLVEQPQS